MVEQVEKQLFFQVALERRRDRGQAVLHGVDHEVDLGDVGQVVQFQEAVDQVDRFPAVAVAHLQRFAVQPQVARVNLAGAQAGPAERRRGPVHLGSVVLGLVGNDQGNRRVVNTGRAAQRVGQTPDHAVPAPHQFEPQVLVGPADGAQHAKAAGYRVQFGGHEAAAVQRHEVRPDHDGQGGAIAAQPPEFAHPFGLALLQAVEDPAGRAAARGAGVEPVGRGVEGQQVVAQPFQFGDGGGRERERAGGDAPRRAGGVRRLVAAQGGGQADQPGGGALVRCRRVRRRTQGGQTGWVLQGPELREFTSARAGGAAADQALRAGSPGSSVFLPEAARRM